MELILGCMVVVGLLYTAPAALADAVATFRASRAGQFDFIDRQRERRATQREKLARAWAERRRIRHQAAGGDGDFRPGARAYVADVYYGWWEDRLGYRRAKRDARGPVTFDPNRPPWHERFDAGVLAKVERLRQSRGWDLTRRAGRVLVDPVGEPKPAEPVAAIVSDEEPAELEPRRTPDGDLYFGDDPADPNGTKRCDWCKGAGVYGGFPCFACGARQQMRNEDWDSRQESKAEVPTGGTMTAPTGEAVNYETTVAELEALVRAQRGHVDHCQAAFKAIGEAKSSINNMQESYRASAAAASLTSEHLAAKNLDGVTLANAGTAADAMPAGVVDAMYDQLEEMESQASARLQDAEVALGVTEANLVHIQATYSAAHETVAGNLGGDSSFLDSGGGVAGGGASGGGFTGGGGWAAPAADEASASGSPTDSGGRKPSSKPSGGKVHTEPINAPGQHFGRGNVYNVAGGTGGVDIPSLVGGSGGDKPNKGGVTNVFKGSVNAPGSSYGTGDVTNNNG